MKKRTIDKGTMARTIALALALVNQLLTVTGLNPIPGHYETWYELMTVAFTFISAVSCWFYNNYITARGRQQKVVLQEKNLTNVK